MISATENSINTKVIEEKWPEVKQILMAEWGMLEPGIKAFIERPIKIVSFNDGVLVLEFKSEKFREVFENDYLISFEASYSQVLKQKITLKLIIASETEKILKDLESETQVDENINPE